VERPSVVRALTSCHGYRVRAEDGVLGEVETPLFPPDSDVPDYLVVRTGAGEERLVAVASVAAVDACRRLVRLDGSVEELSRLPSWLPVAARRR
jgi:hypothetical protein